MDDIGLHGLLCRGGLLQEVPKFPVFCVHYERLRHGVSGAQRCLQVAERIPGGAMMRLLEGEGSLCARYANPIRKYTSPTLVAVARFSLLQVRLK